MSHGVLHKGGYVDEFGTSSLAMRDGKTRSETYALNLWFGKLR